MRLLFAFSTSLLSVAAAFPASATTLHVTQSGTFGSATTATAYSVSNGVFAYGYDLNSNPVSTGSAGGYYEVAISNFSYTLNGLAIAPATQAIFFSIPDPNAMTVCFSAPCDATSVFALEGPEFFTGNHSAPNILPGSYTLTSASFGSDPLADTSAVSITQVGVTPEPSSFVLLGFGMLVAAGMAVKRRFA